MKTTIKTIMIGLIFTSAIHASFATAFWTGKSYRTESVTGRPVVNCEYNLNGRKFWKVFDSYCPSHITVQ